MKNKQVRLALLLGAGFLMLAFPSLVMAQTKPVAQDATLEQARAASKQISGVIESVDNTSFKVRLSDGTVKTYPVNHQIFRSLKLTESIAILLKDSDLEVLEAGQPVQAFNGRIINIKGNQLTVMLTSGQVRTMPIQPEFAAQLEKLQRSPEVPEQMPITGIVHESHPLSNIDHSPSTATTPLPPAARRITQLNKIDATYSDLISACKGREVEVNRLKALQDVANNVIRFDRIKTVNINNLLKGQNVQAFQQQCTKPTQAEQAMLRDVLTNASVIVANTSQTMSLE